MNASQAHVLEVRRWLTICAGTVLGEDRSGAYSAAISLICVAKFANRYTHMADPFKLVDLFDSQEMANAFMQDSVQQNCAQALAMFNEAYPNGYPEG